MQQPRFEPLVVGAPRSGFALLSSVLMHFLPWVRHEPDLNQQILNVLLTGVGDHIAQRIVSVFARHGIEAELLFNPNFRYLVGGPKWIPKDRPDRACFRKYIGVRGKGDFTLVTAHPRQVLNLDPIVHSHTDPQLWVTHPGYSSYTRFASIRSPVDILNSSVFSLNALASEYIQKFIPPELDNDTIRQDLALYKFTDLDFFEGLLRHLIGYFDEFMAVRDRYIVMRWEDLIEAPVPTIMRLAQEGGVPMREDVAAGIWQKLDHVNLTQAHKHNFRAGHGVVGGWKNWITNHHLRLIQEYGFEKHMIALGYGEIEWLDESRYTDFQRKVSGCIASGRVHRDFFDPDLFTFAFNKSNLVSDKFPFKRHGWREHTQIERSIFTDSALEQAVWDSAEVACGEINALVGDFLAEGQNASGRRMEKLLAQLERKHAPGLGQVPGDGYRRAFEQARRLNDANQPPGLLTRLRGRAGRADSAEAFGSEEAVVESPVPHLVAAEAACNVVRFGNDYYALPHRLGPIELDKQHTAVRTMPGVLVTKHMADALEYARNYLP